MSEADAPSAAEHIPDQSAITLGRKFRRIEDECTRRIQREFPLQDQINILLAVLAAGGNFKPSPDIARAWQDQHFIERDRDRAAALFRCMAEHRHAAELLKLHVSKNAAHMNSIDVSVAKFWPPQTERP